MFDNCQGVRHPGEFAVAAAQRRGTVDQSIRKYKDHFSFLRDAKFIRELENDSVDSDIIDEELSALRQSVSISKREKVVKFLQSNPVQVLLCVIVLLDAGIVIAQILLDLNSVKEKLHRRDIQLHSLVGYIRDAYADHLHGYEGTDADHIIRLLRRASLPSPTHLANSPHQLFSTTSFDKDDDVQNSQVLSANASFLSLLFSTASSAVDRRRTDNDRSSTISLTTSATNFTFKTTDSGVDDQLTTAMTSHGNVDAAAISNNGGGHDDDDILPIESESMNGRLAHALHLASIGMLGFLVLEDFVKIVAMGKTFCRHRIEIVDAVIIVSSFTIDLVFLGGVSGEEGQKAVAVLVVLLLWRVARVVDGIVVTVKQRQEFRIRLQKRARRAAERKLDSFEEERLIRTKQIEALKQLCLKAGIRDAEIAACSAAHFGSANSTLGALSSVAHLSVSMTMLMSSTPCNPAATGSRPFASRGVTGNRGSSPKRQQSHQNEYSDSNDVVGYGNCRHQQSHTDRHNRQYQHQQQQQQQPSSSSSTRGLPGSSSGDECITVVQTPPTPIQSYTPPAVTMSAAAILIQSDDDFQRRTKSARQNNPRGVYRRIHGLQGSPTSWRGGHQSSGGRNDTSFRIESLPNVRHDCQPLEMTSSSPDACCKSSSAAAATRRKYRGHVDGLKQQPGGFSNDPNCKRPEGECSGAARANYGLTTSDDDKNNDDSSSTSSESDSLNRMAYDQPTTTNNGGRSAVPARRRQRKRSEKRPDKRPPINERTSSNRSPLTKDYSSSATVTSVIDSRRLLMPEASPVNCSGVRIVIDGSSDCESDSADSVGVAWSRSTGPASVTTNRPQPPTSLPESPANVQARSVLPETGFSMDSSSTSDTSVPVSDFITATSPSDYRSPTTPVSSSSQMFLLSDLAQ